MTNDCNLHCQYCSVLLDCKKSHIPIKPTYSVLELIPFIASVQSKYNDPNVNVYFFGGEPTLEYQSIIEYIKLLKTQLSANYTMRFILHTNGVLLDRIPPNLLEEFSLIMFSINYEKIPKYNLSCSYFSTIIKNAFSTKQLRDIPMIARLTITEKTSLFTEVLQVSNFFDLVYWQIENCISFEDPNAFLNTYTFELALTFDYWLKYLKLGVMIRLVPFMAVLKFMFFPDRSNYEFSCGYSKSMIYIQTDGKCYACSDNVDAGVHHIGNIKTGIELKNLTLDRFACSKCLYRYLCLGRCGRMHIEFSAKHISEYCQMNQFMFDLFIKHNMELKTCIEKFPAYEKELNSWLLEYTEFTP